MSAQTIMTYLTERFVSQEHKDMMELQFDQKLKTFSHVVVPEVLHQNVELILEPLSAVALKGITCTTNDF